MTLLLSTLFALVLEKGHKIVLCFFMEANTRNLYHHLCAARAASGMPGCHGRHKHLSRNFLGLHNGANRQTIYEASGRESRCAQRAMLCRQPRYQAERSESRRQYPQWNAGNGKVTLCGRKSATSGRRHAGK